MNEHILETWPTVMLVIALKRAERRVVFHQRGARQAEKCCIALQRELEHRAERAEILFPKERARFAQEG